MVTAVAMVKDEQDIVEATVRHMASQVDYLIVADNGSTDGTRETLDSLAKELPLTVLDDPIVAYQQSEKMTRLARRAADEGAEWVVPFDADEWWYSPQGRIADVLADQAGAVSPAVLYDHVATGIDAAVANPVERMRWRRSEPGALPKVACRPRPHVTVEMGNHGANYGGETEQLLVVRHFPYRSVEQFVSKVRNGAAAYAASDLPDHFGAHWRQYGKLLEEGGPAAIGDVFRSWFWAHDPHYDDTLTFDPCPTS